LTMTSSGKVLKYEPPRRATAETVAKADMFQAAYELIKQMDEPAKTYRGHLFMLRELQNPDGGERLYFKHLDNLMSFAESLLTSKLWRAGGDTLYIFEETQTGPRKVLVYSRTDAAKPQKKRTHSEEQEAPGTKNKRGADGKRGDDDAYFQLSQTTAAAHHNMTEMLRAKSAKKLKKAEVEARQAEGHAEILLEERKWALQCQQFAAKAYFREIENRTKPGEVLRREEKQTIREEIESEYIDPVARRYLDSRERFT
jgi:hypothetical protein